MRDFYKIISDNIDRVENYKTHEHTLSWCADKVDWLAKWRKLPKEKTDELADKIASLFEQGFYD